MIEESDSGACANDDVKFCASNKLPTVFGCNMPQFGYNKPEEKSGLNFDSGLLCKAACRSGKFRQVQIMAYKYYNDRLETFKTWPCSDRMKPSQLAKAGFRYTGQGDRCICEWCETVLHSWDYFDEPISEHRRHNPKCEYLKMILPS